MNLDESGRLAGANSWNESRLFEILGAWVPSTPEAEAKLLLDGHSQHHAWRAAQWWDRLPVVADVDRDTLVVAASPSLDAMLGALSSVEGTVARLSGAYRVALPRLAGTYRAHRAAANPASDGATLRTLDIVEADLWADWREGEIFVQTLLDSGDAVEVAATTVGRLERMLSSDT